jgi:hypothetical protein
MRYKVKRHHEGLRMKNGINGHYLYTMDNERVMVERIVSISLTTDDLNSFCVIATLRSGKRIDLFSHSDFEFVEKKLENYRNRFEILKRWK